MKNIFIFLLMLVSTSVFSQNYQADYTSSFVNIQSNQNFDVLLVYPFTISNSDIAIKNQGEIQVHSLFFLESGILFKGVRYSDSSPDLIRSSGDVVFIPYSNVLSASENGSSDFVLVMKN